VSSTEHDRARREFQAWEEARQAGNALARPGWYADPKVPETERYWTGTAWSEVFRPVGARPKPTTVLVWLLVVVPFVDVALALLAPRLYAQSFLVSVGVVVALNSVLAYADSRKIEEKGFPAPQWGWALILVPVYLIQRTRKVGSTALIPVLWFAVVLVSVISTAT
jgi:hypothetical protein